MIFNTADLCDKYSTQSALQILEAVFKSYGKNKRFCGQISTLKVFEDNVLVREVLEEKVSNRILVIDGGGSHHCALLGADIAKMAMNNGWQGILVYGCIRDSVEINQLAIGIRALHTHPLKSHKHGIGHRDGLIHFAGGHFKKDYFLYADEDGIIVSETELR